MIRKILGLFVVMTIMLFIGCKSPTTDTPAKDTSATETATSTSDKTITLLDISGVVPPVRGAMPVTTITETAQYTGTITWTPSDSSYAASTLYTANIVLTAKAGWTLTGVAANSFKVMGATATNAANKGIVTAVFPATAAAPGNATANDYVSANIGTLKYVPAGSFQRDYTVTNISTISTAFRMSAYEITRAQFLAVMGTDPSDATCSNGNTDPVQCVSWYQALAFCNKLSIAEGLNPVYTVTGVDFATLTYPGIPATSNAAWNAVTATWTNSGYRLPTEMEWMWAAMGAAGTGINTTGYKKYFAGSTGTNALGDYAWYSANVTDGKSRPVGGKLPNELGLYDMNGNVWEWNWDWYADNNTWPNYTVSGTLVDYRGTASGANRVEHGGGWNSNMTNCTIAYWYYHYPYYRYNNIGFRVVRL